MIYYIYSIKGYIQIVLITIRFTTAIGTELAQGRDIRPLAHLLKMPLTRQPLAIQAGGWASSV